MNNIYAEQVKNQIAIMQAWLAGKQIEFFNEVSQSWLPIVNPSFDFQRYKYRVESEPVYERVSSIHEATHAKRSYWPDLYKIASYTISNGNLSQVGLYYINLNNEEDVSYYHSTSEGQVCENWEFYKEVK